MANDGDLTYKSALVVNLAKAAAAFVEKGMAYTPAEVQNLVAAPLVAGKLTLSVFIQMQPFAIAVHALPTDPVLAADPANCVLLFGIKSPEDGAGELC